MHGRKRPFTAKNGDIRRSYTGSVHQRCHRPVEKASQIGKNWQKLTGLFDHSLLIEWIDFKRKRRFRVFCLGFTALDSNMILKSFISVSFSKYEYAIPLP